MKVGHVLEDRSVRAAEAARLGGLDFEVELRTAGFLGSDGHWHVERSRKAVTRKDTGQWFSYVSNSYKVVQYTEAFSFMDAVSPNYVAAGTLNHGRQGFMVVQLPGHLSVNPTLGGENDPHDLYVILRTSHDMSKAMEIAVMPLRGKCMNQLALRSLTKDAPQRWSFKHVGDTDSKLRQALQTLTGAERYASVFERTVTQLHSVVLNGMDVTQILERVLPDKPRRSEQIAAITTAYEESPQVGFTGTGWGLTNAVSEYFEWQRESNIRTDQSRFTSGLNGDTYKYVNRTAQLLLSR